METAVKKFRMSEYVKDGYLAEALRNELADLRGDQLTLAQDAITEVANAGIPGTFEDLFDAYKRAIRRALQPERKLVKNPAIDRKIIKNPDLATRLDRELKDVTQAELDRVNVALKKVIDEAREVTVTKGGPGQERFVKHNRTEVCDISREHSTLPSDDHPGCGYFKDPIAWTDILRGVVRKALAT